MIGAGTAAVCSLISGERGWAVLDSAIQGFIAGAFPIAGVFIALNDAVELGIDVAQRTGNDFYGVVAFTLSMGVSSFTGENISKLKGVVGMDEAAKLFFDAFFGLMANVFHAQVMVDIFPAVPREQADSNQANASNKITPPPSGNIYQHALVY